MWESHTVIFMPGVALDSVDLSKILWHRTICWNPWWNINQTFLCRLCSPDWKCAGRSSLFRKITYLALKLVIKSSHCFTMEKQRRRLIQMKSGVTSFQRGCSATAIREKCVKFLRSAFCLFEEIIMRKYHEPSCPAWEGQRWLLMDLNRVIRASFMIGFCLARGSWCQEQWKYETCPREEHCFHMTWSDVRDSGEEIYTPVQRGRQVSSRKLT